MTMRDHTIKPKGWVRKDRTYILIEKDHLLHSLWTTFHEWRSRIEWPGSEEIFNGIIAALQAGDLPRVLSFKEEVRQACWGHMGRKSLDINKSTGLLMWLDMLSGTLEAIPKEGTKDG